MKRKAVAACQLLSFTPAPSCTRAEFEEWCELVSIRRRVRGLSPDALARATARAAELRPRIGWHPRKTVAWQYEGDELRAIRERNLRRHTDVTPGADKE